MGILDIFKKKKTVQQKLEEMRAADPAIFVKLQEDERTWFLLKMRNHSNERIMSVMGCGPEKLAVLEERILSRKP